MDERDLDRIYQRLDAGFTQLNARLDVLNGRTRVNEKDIAVLQDRAGAGKAAVWGGGLGAAVVAVIEAVKAFWK